MVCQYASKKYTYGLPICIDTIHIWSASMHLKKYTYGLPICIDTIHIWSASMHLKNTHMVYQYAWIPYTYGLPVCN